MKNKADKLAINFPSTVFQRESFDFPQSNLQGILSEFSRLPLIWH